MFAAVTIAVLGLAVPVTASFIIAWVIIGPALQTLGVTAPETAMFIFYYAVLSEVTPPTALAAVAAAAITGGNTIGTMWQAWKYTLPAFLAPIAFVITDNGSHLLMQGGVCAVVWTTAGVDRSPSPRWPRSPAAGSSVRPRGSQRLLCLPAAVLLLYLQPVTDRRRPRLPRRRRRREPDHPKTGRPTPWGNHHDPPIPACSPPWRVTAVLVRWCRVRRPASRPPRRRRPPARRRARPAAGQITIATGNSTGVYYVLGGGLASLISANTPLKATAAETGASVQNIQQLVAGEYDIAFSLADTAADAVRGQGAFTAPQHVQALARIYSNYTHVVVQRRSGITSMADFRGKRISTGSPEVGHRGHRQPAAAGGRAEPGDRRPAAAPRAGQDHRRR